MDSENTQDQKRRGRPITVDIKNHPERKRTYYHNTKTHLMCECGCLVLKQSLAKHMHTKKHEQYLAYKDKLDD